MPGQSVWLKIWNGLKSWGYTWIGGLFMREKSNGQMAVSLSRTTFAGIVVYLFTFWNAWKPRSVEIDSIVKALDKLDLTKGVDAAQLKLLIAETITSTVAAMPGQDALPPGLMEVFYTVAGIAFGTKLTDAIKNRGTNKPPV